MAQVYVSIGSNIEREKNIRAGVQELREQFGDIVLSPVYESISVGFEGDNFYNLAAGFSTDLSVDKLNKALGAIEDRHGRDRSGPRFSSRTLDIDLLLYDDVISDAGCVLPRPEIYKNAFVLKPLADIAGDIIDPLKTHNYHVIWETFSKTNDQELWEIPFSF
jgi:2-amino-4-hydroxy-6-hydroxymethyldihydropteridine diphosphokinase